MQQDLGFGIISFTVVRRAVLRPPTPIERLHSCTILAGHAALEGLAEAASGRAEGPASHAVSSLRPFMLSKGKKNDTETHFARA